MAGARRVPVLVQQLLECSAERTPDQVAVVAGDRRATYAEIDRAANQLAHALRANGVQRGDRVVIVLDNSVEAVVSIFGTLKADAVFVALHPTTKAGKLVQLMAD